MSADVGSPTYWYSLSGRGFTERFGGGASRSGSEERPCRRGRFQPPAVGARHGAGRLEHSDVRRGVYIVARVQADGAAGPRNFFGHGETVTPPVVRQQETFIDPATNSRRLVSELKTDKISKNHIFAQESHLRSRITSSLKNHIFAKGQMRTLKGWRN